MSKKLLHSLLLVLGLSPVASISADTVIEGTRSQTTESQKWIPIQKWIENNEKESLLSEYYESLESVDISSIFLSLLDDKVSVITSSENFSIIRTPTKTSVIKHPLKIKNTTFNLNNIVLPETVYAGQFNMRGMYGSQDSSYGEGDIWFPMWQRPDQVAFFNARFIKSEGVSQGFNLGGGYRWLSQDLEQMYGLYAFYDNKTSSLSNIFQQVTLGGEFRTEHWSARANYYLPVGTTAYRVPENDLWKWAEGDYNYLNLFISAGYDQALGGFDTEIGRTIPYLTGLSLFGGYFYLTNVNLPQVAQGPRIRAEYDLTQVLYAPSFFRNIVIEGAWQNDPVRGNIFTVGARISIPLGSNSGIKSGTAQPFMNDYVRRDSNISTVIANTNYAVYSQDGSAVTFDIIDSAAEFEQALANPVRPDVILVDGDINLSGEQGPFNVGSDITITGGEYHYTVGNTPGTFNFIPNSTTPIITAPANSDLFLVGQNVTILELNLMLTPTNSTTQLPYNAVTNSGGGSVGTLIIDNITTNGAINITVADGSTNSNISITDSIFNISAAGTSANSAKAIDIVSSSNSTVTVSAIDNNDITFTTPEGTTTAYQNGIELITEENGALIIKSITGNQISFGDNVNGVGINLINDSGTQTITSIDNNQVSFGDSVNGVGINLINNSGTQTVTSINDNSITFGYNADAVGINLINDNGTTQTIGTLDNNTITLGSINNQSGDLVNIYGIQLINNGGTQNITTSIDQNTITFADVDSTANNLNVYGISILNTNEGNQNIASVSTNSISFGNYVPDNTVQAPILVKFYGINIDNQGNNQILGNVNTNTITMGSGDDASSEFSGYGIYITNGLPFPTAETTPGRNQTIDTLNDNTIYVNNLDTFNGAQVYGFYIVNNNPDNSGEDSADGYFITVNSISGNSVTNTDNTAIFSMNVIENNLFGFFINIHGININNVTLEQLEEPIDGLERTIAAYLNNKNTFDNAVIVTGHSAQHPPIGP